MLPTKLYSEYSTENFGESFFIYSQEGLTYDEFKHGIQSGRLAVRFNRRYAELMINEKSLMQSASFAGRAGYYIRRNLSALMVITGIAMIVLNIVGLLGTGWWLGLATLFAGFLATGYSMQATERFLLDEILNNKLFYEKAGELSHNRLLMIGINGGIAPV